MQLGILQCSYHNDTALNVSHGYHSEPASWLLTRHKDETQAQPPAKGQSAAQLLALHLVLPQFPHLPWEECLRYFLLYGLFKAKCINAWEWSCVFFFK